MPISPLAANANALAIQVDGGVRILPRVEADRWDELADAVKLDMLALAERVRRTLGGRRHTIGYDTDASPPSVLVLARATADGGIDGLRPGEPALTTGPERPLLRAIRPLIRSAAQIDVLAAFVQESGLRLLQPTLLDALARGATLRILTGDYLNITQSTALRRLLDWQRQTRAFQQDDREDAAPLPGVLEVRVFETALSRQSFHPKSWRLAPATGGAGVADVGSSNLSYSALRSGVEWNLRLEQARQPAAYAEVEASFAALWAQARPVDEAWVADYERRAEAAAVALPAGEVEAELIEAPRPTAMQQEALAALARSRAEGRGRALVVLATGLGKTFLAAFDVLAWSQGAGRRPRVLFVAHRRELLQQAAATFRRLLPHAAFGWMVGAESQLEGEVVFASIQKLSRPEHLDRIPGDAFDYVIIDEVHHAAARSYRRLLRRLAPGFLLGLTATPERADEADILRLFDDHIAHRADLGEGIRRGLLVPFRYIGLADTVDYGPLPWRGGRFDPEALSAAVSTQDRMERLWDAWQVHTGQRTLVFCTSIPHARFVRDWLRGRGVRAEAIHSGPDSADRQQAVEDLEDGVLDALCAVDLLNEGVDIRAVDRVVMLRPTESGVIFLQQLGRGLRTAPQKQHLVVIDFVGNHRVFLERLRSLLLLGGDREALQEYLGADGIPALPGGCTVDLAPAARAALRTLLPRGDGNELVRLYRELRTSRGRRPLAGELVRLGLDPGALRARAGGWLRFLAEEDDLTGAELRAVASGRAWLEAVEQARVGKSFKLVMLEVLVQSEALEAGMPLEELAWRCHAAYLRSPALFRDLTDTQRLADPRSPEPARWLAYWRDRALRGGTGLSGQSWFLVEDGWLRPRLPFPRDAVAAEAFVALTAELVDWQLVRYRRQRAPRGLDPAFEARLLWPGDRPRLQLPPGQGLRGELIARTPDGQPWRLQFSGDGVAARPLLSAEDQLRSLARAWFGPLAGHPAYRHRVRFTPTPDGWWFAPVGGQPPPFRERQEVRIARLAQLSDRYSYGEEEESTVRLPAPEDPALAAARAEDDRMDGGTEPIRRGDWLILRPQHSPLSASHGRRVVVADPRQGPRLRRAVREGDRFLLRADAPGSPAEAAPSAVEVVAALLHAVPAEALAPHEGASLWPDALARGFGLSTAPIPPDDRVDGHRFLMLEAPGTLIGGDRLRAPVTDPAEAAYVLTRSAAEQPWRYAGAARPRLESPGDEVWTFPGVDAAAWAALGSPGEAPERTLPPEPLQQARSLARALAVPRPAWRLDGQRWQILGRRRDGGLRVAPEEGDPLTLSLQDLGWCLLARMLLAPLQEAVHSSKVLRLRYLTGTPPAICREQETRLCLVLIETISQDSEE